MSLTSSPSAVSSYSAMRCVAGPPTRFRPQAKPTTRGRSLLFPCLQADGPLEFIFVLESKLDPAHAAITQLLLKRGKAGAGEDAAGAGGGSPGPAEKGGSGGGGGAGGGSGEHERTHRVVFSGAATRTSQKIHK